MMTLLGMDLNKAGNTTHNLLSRTFFYTGATQCYFSLGSSIGFIRLTAQLRVSGSKIIRFTFNNISYVLDKKAMQSSKKRKLSLYFDNPFCLFLSILDGQTIAKGMEYAMN